MTWPRREFSQDNRCPLSKLTWMPPDLRLASSVQSLGKQGIKRIDVVCPGFIADCLETLEEIAMEVKHDFIQAGGKEFHYIPCLNENQDWLKGLAEICEQHLSGWPTKMTVGLREQQKQHSLLSAAEAKRIGAIS